MGPNDQSSRFTLIIIIIASMRNNSLPVSSSVMHGQCPLIAVVSPSQPTVVITTNRVEALQGKLCRMIMMMMKTNACLI